MFHEKTSKLPMVMSHHESGSVGTKIASFFTDENDQNRQYFERFSSEVHKNC